MHAAIGIACIESAAAIALLSASRSNAIAGILRLSFFAHGSFVGDKTLLYLAVAAGVEEIGVLPFHGFL